MPETDFPFHVGIEKGTGNSILLIRIRKKKRKSNALIFFEPQQKLFFVTGLRAAGLPAELKHITQRRKRKQQ